MWVGKKKGSEPHQPSPYMASSAVLILGDPCSQHTVAQYMAICMGGRDPLGPEEKQREFPHQNPAVSTLTLLSYTNHSWALS